MKRYKLSNYKLWRGDNWETRYRLFLRDSLFGIPFWNELQYTFSSEEIAGRYLDGFNESYTLETENGTRLWSSKENHENS